MVRHLPNLGSRKFRTLAIGGALCLATAGSVTAATLPSSAASGTGATQSANGSAANGGMVNGGPVSGSPVSGSPVSSGDVTATAVRLTAATIASAEAAHEAAVHVAAMRAAAVRAAATAKTARERAGHLAHEQHLAVVSARAQAARQAAAAQAAAQAAARQAATQQAAAQKAAAQQQPTQVTSASEPSGSPRQIAQQLLAADGEAGQFSCLDSLWERESGWNVYAENPSSGAYGIAQALPGSKMASAGADWQTDATTQIRWGLSYIDSTYGSPCGAWDHEEADGWY